MLSRAIQGPKPAKISGSTLPVTESTATTSVPPRATATFYLGGVRFAYSCRLLAAARGDQSGEAQTAKADGTASDQLTARNDRVVHRTAVFGCVSSCMEPLGWSMTLGQHRATEISSSRRRRNRSSRKNNIRVLHDVNLRGDQVLGGPPSQGLNRLRWAPPARLGKHDAPSTPRLGTS